jgi:hypothetical protein
VELIELTDCFGGHLFKALHHTGAGTAGLAKLLARTVGAA